MTWLVWVFWVLVLAALMLLAENARLDARAREMSDELDKDMGRKPCEDCNDIR